MTAIDLLILAGLTAGAWVFLAMPLMWLMGRFGGWQRLAARYPRREVARAGVVRRGWTGWVWLGSWGWYHGSVAWVADEDHLHLRMWPGCGTGHPPVSIPWAEVEFLPARRRGGPVAVMVGGEHRMWLLRRMAEGELRVRGVGVKRGEVRR